MAESDGGRPDSADEILIVLTRAAPGSVERAEILSEVGLGTDAVRAGLSFLEEEGEVIETAEGDYKYVDKDEKPSAATEPSDRVASALGAGLTDDEEPPGPALDAHIRSTFEVTCSFARAGSENDSVALEKSRAISVEIGNALAMAFPRLEWHVEIAGVEAYDKPRSLWPPSDESG